MLGFQRGAKHPFGQGRGSMPRPRSRAPRNVRREFTWTLFKDKHPEKKDPGGVNGNWHWVDKSGTPLWQLAENFLADQLKK
jgi:hypothetical protein